LLNATEEFDACLKKRLNLRFEPLLLASILKSFDDTGDGKIDYRKFCEYVMGSTQRTQTSLTIGQIPGRSKHVSADSGESPYIKLAIIVLHLDGTQILLKSDDFRLSGNNDMMVRRKIRMSLKPLRASFRDLIDGQTSVTLSLQHVGVFNFDRTTFVVAGQGGISQKDLGWVLSRYDIDLTTSQFSKMMTALGCKSEQDSVKWDRFHQYFKEAEVRARIHHCPYICIAIPQYLTSGMLRNSDSIGLIAIGRPMTTRMT
jgi:hypothetical protein